MSAATKQPADLIRIITWSCANCNASGEFEAAWSDDCGAIWQRVQVAHSGCADRYLAVGTRTDGAQKKRGKR